MLYLHGLTVYVVADSVQLFLVLVGAWAGYRQLLGHLFVVKVELALLQSVLAGVHSDQSGAIGVGAGARHNRIRVHSPRIVDLLIEVFAASPEAIGLLRLAEHAVLG